MNHVNFRAPLIMLIFVLH